MLQMLLHFAFYLVEDFKSWTNLSGMKDYNLSNYLCLLLIIKETNNSKRFKYMECYSLFRRKKMSIETYEYVIYAGNKPVLKGKNLKKLLEDAKAKYKSKKISISWEAPEGILIAKENF